MSKDAPLFAPTIADRPPNWFARNIRGFADTKNALAAIKNRLAEARAGTVDARELRNVLRRYGVRSKGGQRQVLQQCYRDAVAGFASRGGLNNETVRQALETLGVSLGLNDSEIESNRQQVLREIYQQAVAHAFEDRNFSEGEKSGLEQLGISLGLQDHDQRVIIETEASLIITALSNELLTDRRYSADDEERIRSLATSLGARLAIDDDTHVLLNRFRLLWEIENGKLPSVSTPIALQRGEVCHFSCSCSWREHRTRTVRVDYVGVTSSVKIMKGVRLRAGTIAPRRVTQTDLAEIARGTLYITNKRALLDGVSTNKVVTWRTVFGIEAYSDAIMLEKSAGKNPYLFVSEDSAETLAVLITAILAGQK